MNTGGLGRGGHEPENWLETGERTLPPPTQAILHLAVPMPTGGFFFPPGQHSSPRSHPCQELPNTAAQGSRLILSLLPISFTAPWGLQAPRWRSCECRSVSGLLQHSGEQWLLQGQAAFTSGYPEDPSSIQMLAYRPGKFASSLSAPPAPPRLEAVLGSWTEWMLL